MHFVNKAHENRFALLRYKDNTKDGDAERESFFYLVAYDKVLFDKIEELYDFAKRQPKLWDLNTEKNEVMCNIEANQKAILKLAYYLLDDIVSCPVALCQVFKAWNDGENIVMLTAISIRYNLAYEISLMSTIKNEYLEQHV